DYAVRRHDYSRQGPSRILGEPVGRTDFVPGRSAAPPALLPYFRRDCGRPHSLSRGDTNKLGEAYAFGVVWSFFMNSLGVLVLRYHRKDQEYKVPLNFRIGS